MFFLTRRARKGVLPNSGATGRRLRRPVFWASGALVARGRAASGTQSGAAPRIGRRARKEAVFARVFKPPLRSRLVVPGEIVKPSDWAAPRLCAKLWRLPKRHNCITSTLRPTVAAAMRLAATIAPARRQARPVDQTRAIAREAT